MRRVAIVGSRKLSGEPIRRMIRGWLESINMDSIRVVSGGAEGVDTEAETVSEEMGLPRPLVIRPDWSLGKGAGFIRNTDIVKASDEVFAIWDGQSPGTKNTMNTAVRLGKPLHVYIPGR